MLIYSHSQREERGGERREMKTLFDAAGGMLGRGEERRAEEIAAEAAEEVEETASIVLCDYVSIEEAAEVSEEMYEHVFSITYDALMRRFSAKHVCFRKEEIAKEVAAQVAEEMGMIASIYLSDFTDTDKAIEGGMRVKEYVRTAVHDAIMRNF